MNGASQQLAMQTGVTKEVKDHSCVSLHNTHNPNYLTLTCLNAESTSPTSPEKFKNRMPLRPWREQRDYNVN